MQEIGSWDAIRLWLDGDSLADYTMMGLPFVWWGRAGKIASIVGGLVVVLDYVGEERLRGWGSKLRDKPLRKLLTRIKSGCLPALIAVVAIVLVSVQVDHLIDERIGRIILPLVVWIAPYTDGGWFWCWLALLAAGVGLGLFFEKRGAGVLEGVSFCIAGIPVYGFFAVALIREAPAVIIFGTTFLIVAVLMWLLARIGDIAIVSFDPLVIRPIAWALARETPGQPIRWAGFILLLFGQLIDLLAS